MSEHTPGPWKTHGSHVYAPDGEIIAVIHNPGSKQSDYPLVANRDLIAQAWTIPALREALEGLLAEHVQLVSSGDCGNWDVETEYPVIQARAVLKLGQENG